MNSQEYAKLDSIEKQHWFYHGKRDIIRFWLNKYCRLQHDDLYIDAGCGTGIMLLEMSEFCRVQGLDNYDDSLALALPRVVPVGGKVTKTGLNKVALPDRCATVLTLLDVLEHLDDDAGALDEMIRLVRPGGLLLITVPALRWLWSDWDIALHHRRRYHLPQFRTLVNRPGVEVLRCCYINAFALLPIFAARLWRRIFPPPPGVARAEDRVPPDPINRLLYLLFVRPARWSWFRPPFGVSLLAVLRREDADEHTRQNYCATVQQDCRV